MEQTIIILFSLVLLLLLVLYRLYVDLKNRRTQEDKAIETAQNLAVITSKLEDKNQQFIAQQKRFETEQSTWKASELRLQKELNQKSDQIAELMAQRSELSTELKNTTSKLQNKQQEIEALNTKLTSEFENIANRILKTKGDDLTAHSHHELKGLLLPLQEKLSEFKTQVERSYNKGHDENLSLKEQITHMMSLNQKMSEEATNLTTALKGNKSQGNWGEMVLNKILESSGLQPGKEYKEQDSTRDDSGHLFYPDVVIYLPHQKHIIIDSKVSLSAYQRVLTANTELERTQALKQHIVSIKKHVDELSNKNYQSLSKFNSPDFVLMFLPIEASFSIAVQESDDLFQYAWTKNIVIVSPTTLLATLRTIASTWKNENQSKNALEIAKYSGKLYDKLSGTLEDWDALKKHLVNASKAYNKAMNKLYDGRGNIFASAEKIKTLGANTTKTLEEKDRYLSEESMSEH